jgi:hypothetical protein
VILVSPSGITGPWQTAFTVPSPNSLGGVAFGNGSFVAVGSGACTQSGQCNSVVFKASASGRDWSQAATIPDEVFDVAYGNGKWLAVGGKQFGGTGAGGATVYQSTDAITWSKVTLVQNDVIEFVVLTSVAFGDGRWVAVAGMGNGREVNYELLASPDGSTWTEVGNAASGIAQVAHGTSGWLAIGASSGAGESGTQFTTIGTAQTSTDGTTWMSSPTSPASLAAYSPVFAGGRWYVTRHDNGRTTTAGVDLLSSTDGITWAPSGGIPVPGAASGKGSEGPSVADMAVAT